MTDYEKLYFKTFNAMTDAQRLIQATIALLRKAQQECEEIYIGADDEQ